MIAGRGGATTTFGGEQLALLPERAALWPRERTLFLADMHIGKAAAFRALGVPAPEQVTAADLDRLSALIERTGAERIVVLGDLIHARSAHRSVAIRSLAAWRSHHAELTITLVRGNHDLSAGDPCVELAIECADPPAMLPPFTLVHDPAEAPPGQPSLAGHIHPAARLSCAKGRPGTLHAPCFWRRRDVLILPSFGSFTGSARIRAVRGDGVWVIGDGSVIGMSAGSAAADAPLAE